MTAIIISFINFLGRVLDTAMPDLSVDSGYLSNVVTGLDMVIDFMAQVNFIVPLPTILLITSIVFSFRLTKFIIFIVNWIVRRIADVIP